MVKFCICQDETSLFFPPLIYWLDFWNTYIYNSTIWNNYQFTKYFGWPESVFIWVGLALAHPWRWWEATHWGCYPSFQGSAISPIACTKRGNQHFMRCPNPRHPVLSICRKLMWRFSLFHTKQITSSSGRHGQLAGCPRCLQQERHTGLPAAVTSYGNVQLALKPTCASSQLKPLHPAQIPVLSWIPPLLLFPLHLPLSSPPSPFTYLFISS